MPPRKHALLSASAAHRWLNCTPSAKATDHLPDETSEAAAEGTAAHALAEWHLLADHEKTPRPTSKWDSPDMEQHATDYARYVRDCQKTEQADLFVEQHLNYSRWVPDGFGTGDALLASNHMMHVIDLKYGKGVKIWAKHNPQLKLYALGAWDMLKSLYDTTKIRVTIYQPRLGHIDSWDTSIQELTNWAQMVVAPRAHLAFKGQGEYKPGDWCRFCKLRPTCRALADKHMEEAQAAFTPTPPSQLTETETAQILLAAPEIKNWLGAVEKHALAQAKAGVHYPGLKLVAGRSTRRITNETLAAQRAQAAGINPDSLFGPPKMVGITALTKILGGQARMTQILGDALVKPEGAPTLVAETDKRPPIDVGETFKPINKQGEK